MYRKILVFMNEAGDKERVYIRNGEVRTRAAMDKVMANDSGYSLNTLKTTGNTQPEPVRLRFEDKRNKAPLNIPIEFLGYQNPPKVAVKPVELDAEGKALPAKRGKKSSITPAILLEMKRLAGEDKTLKETETALGIAYATLFQTAKKEGITFKKGKKGRKKKEAAVEVTVVNIRAAQDGDDLSGKNVAV